MVFIQSWKCDRTKTFGTAFEMKSNHLQCKKRHLLLVVYTKIDAEGK